jgi:Flp pilus assembly protein TadG
VIRKWSERAREEEGQSLVESALLFLLLITLVLGVIDFGFIFYGYVSVVSAAHEGAAFAALSSVNASNPTAIRSAALGETSRWNCSSLAVTSSLTPDSAGYPMVSVTVACQVGNLTAIPDSFTGATVQATARRRVKP